MDARGTSRRLTLAERRREWRRIGFGSYGTRGLVLAILATLGAMGCAATSRWTAASFLTAVATVVWLGLYLLLPPVMSDSTD